LHRGRAGVEQGKAAGAIGGFHHARRKTGLADGGGLLVAGDAEDGDELHEQFRHAVAEVGGRVLTSGSIERGTRRIFSSSSSHSPLWMLNSSVREALVASVRVARPPVSRHSR
jgi:hypothetical protein